MAQKDGPKRLGRFIKKENSKLIESLAMSEFSFEEISEEPITYHDNPNSNLIRVQMHEKSSLVPIVQVPEAINKDLRDEESRLPIIFPVDFTAEWKRHSQKAASRFIRL